MRPIDWRIACECSWNMEPHWPTRGLTAVLRNDKEALATAIQRLPTILQAPNVDALCLHIPRITDGLAASATILCSAATSSLGPLETHNQWRPPQRFVGQYGELNFTRSCACRVPSRESAADESSGQVGLVRHHTSNDLEFRHATNFATEPLQRVLHATGIAHATNAPTRLP